MQRGLAILVISLLLTACDAARDEVSQRAGDVDPRAFLDKACPALKGLTGELTDTLGPVVNQVATPQVLQAGVLGLIESTKVSSENYERVLRAVGAPKVSGGQAVYDEALEKLDGAQEKLGAASTDVKEMDTDVTAAEFRERLNNTEVREALAETSAAIKVITESEQLQAAGNAVAECSFTDLG